MSDRPAFRCAWEPALFLHYEVDPAVLQPRVPFPLDLREGRAWVSVVAIAIRPLGLVASAPLLARQTFLNVRTYVRPGGIHFLTGWLPNPLCVLLGPALVGIPYRLGRFRFEPGMRRGEVRAAGGRFRFRADPGAPARCAPGSLDAFLLERYVAFTRHGSRRRSFQVWHEPWTAAPALAEVEDATLLEPWLRAARPAAAHLTAPLPDVGMGRPRRLEAC